MITRDTQGGHAVILSVYPRDMMSLPLYLSTRHPEVRVISLVGLAALSPDAGTATNSSGANILMCEEIKLFFHRVGKNLSSLWGQTSRYPLILTSFAPEANCCDSYNLTVCYLSRCLCGSGCLSHVGALFLTIDAGDR